MSFARGFERGIRIGDLLDRKEARDEERERERIRFAAQQRAATRHRRWEHGLALIKNPDGSPDYDRMLDYTRKYNPSELGTVLGWEQAHHGNELSGIEVVQAGRREDALSSAAAQPGGVTLPDLERAEAVGGNTAAVINLRQQQQVEREEQQGDVLRQALGVGYQKGGAQGARDAAGSLGYIGVAQGAQDLDDSITIRNNDDLDRAQRMVGRRMLDLNAGADGNFAGVFPILRNDVRQQPELFTQLIGLDPKGHRQVIDLEMQEVNGEVRVTPLIHNSQTGTTGPMTESGTAHGADTVMSVSPDQLMEVFAGWAGVEGPRAAGAGAAGDVAPKGKYRGVAGAPGWVINDVTGDFVRVPESAVDQSDEIFLKAFPDTGLNAEENQVLRGHGQRLVQQMVQENYNPKAAARRLVSLIDPSSPTGRTLQKAETAQEIAQAQNAILIAARGESQADVARSVSGILNEMMGKGTGKGPSAEFGRAAADAAREQGINPAQLVPSLAAFANDHPDVVNALKNAYKNAADDESKEALLESLISLSVENGEGAGAEPQSPLSSAVGAPPAPAAPNPSTGGLPTMPRRPGGPPKPPESKAYPGPAFAP